MQGWVKLHRQLLGSGTFANEKLLKVWIYCLLKATHDEFEQIIGRQKVKLKPGQFVYGRKKAAAELDMTESTVRDYIELLSKNRNIEIKSTNKYSVISIVKWACFQEKDEVPDSKSASKRTAESQQKDTYKNGKNGKNGIKIKDTMSQKFCDDSPPIILSKYLYQKILTNDEKAKEPDFQKWAEHMDKLLRIDKRGEEEVRRVIQFCQTDNFWKSNILSTKKLREKFSTLLIQSGKGVVQNGRDFSHLYTKDL